MSCGRAWAGCGPPGWSGSSRRQPRPGNGPPGAPGQQGTAYLPGPQFHRLTEAARRRLQEELILAAGPDTPLAAAIRRRRAHEKEPA